MIEIKRIKSSEVERIVEIDRSEHVTLGYFCRAGKLESEQGGLAGSLLVRRGPEAQCSGHGRIPTHVHEILKEHTYGDPTRSCDRQVRFLCRAVRA
jgi:hypothetical protein